MSNGRQTMYSESTTSLRNTLLATSASTSSNQDMTNVDSMPLCSETVPSDSRQEAHADDGVADDDISHYPMWQYLIRLNNNLSLQLRPELFLKSSHPSDPFHLRETQEALRFYDDYLPDHPIHILRLGQDVLLRLRMTQDPASPYPIEHITDFSLQVPDEEFVKMQTVQRVQRETSEVVGLLRPSAFAANGRMNAVSPSFGIVDRKGESLAFHLCQDRASPKKIASASMAGHV